MKRTVLLILFVSLLTSLNAQYKSKIRFDTVLVEPAYRKHDHAMVLYTKVRFYVYEDSTAILVMPGFINTSLKLQYINKEGTYTYKPTREIHTSIAGIYARGAIDYIMMYPKTEYFYVHLKEDYKSFFMFQKTPSDTDGLPDDPDDYKKR